MKKLILSVMLVSGTLFLLSCTKTCTCVNPDSGKVQEVEIDPSENCSARSSTILGVCS